MGEETLKYGYSWFWEVLGVFRDTEHLRYVFNGEVSLAPPDKLRQRGTKAPLTLSPSTSTPYYLSCKGGAIIGVQGVLIYRLFFNIGVFEIWAFLSIGVFEI
jgi:hypothetical protein